MGYTHYFPHQKVSNDVWNEILKDVNKIMDNIPEYSHSSGDYYSDIPLQLVNGMGEIGTKPIINDEMICFNGKEPQYDHETFELLKEGSNGFCFCKTARKPYDLITQACLLIYKYHSPNTIKLRSDGNHEDWIEATKYINNLFNYNMSNPMWLKQMTPKLKTKKKPFNPDAYAKQKRIDDQYEHHKTRNGGKSDFTKGDSCRSVYDKVGNK